jgi:phage terminase large subunit-like protein
VGSTNRWLSLGGWEKGKRSFTLADLEGRDCCLGLDLSRTRDMTGAAFLFPFDELGEDVLRFWPMAWIPEETAKEREHLFPYESWVRAEALTLTPGGVVDYRRVKTDLRAVVKKHKLRVCGVYFDQHYAEEFTQALVDGDADGDGWSCERIAVPQTLMALSGPAKEFERRISAGLIHHPGNAVLTWQVGHCEVISDRNQNIRPVKPSPKSGKSIDLIAAAVDAMAGIASGAGGITTIYENRRLEVI